MSVFIFTLELTAQSGREYKLRDLHGTVLITQSLKRYRDTLVFQQPHTNSFRKIPVRSIQSINGHHPDSAGLRNQPYPTETAALIRLRKGQLVSFWVRPITTCLALVFSNAYLPIAITGGGVSLITYLSSYGGIRKMKKYQKTPLVLNY
ncbi:MAG: hypothetical protein KJS92_00370 [Bacteroidetes bacterium]|nr:hypothetical protein [Bacteroidota bacterium]